jgi:hypothetical protein
MAVPRQSATQRPSRDVQRYLPCTRIGHFEGDILYLIPWMALLDATQTVCFLSGTLAGKPGSYLGIAR